MTPKKIVEYMYTIKEGVPEPHKDRPCAELDLAATKRAMDWRNSQRASMLAVSKMPSEKRAEFWVERWYVVERTHCLLRCIQELWQDIPEMKRPFTSWSTQKFYKGCDNVRNHALVSL